MTTDLHPDERAVQEAVGAVEEDLRQLLRDHLDDLSHALREQMNASFEALTARVRAAGDPRPEVPAEPADSPASAGQRFESAVPVDDSGWLWASDELPRWQVATAIAMVGAALALGCWWLLSPDRPSRTPTVARDHGSVARLTLPQTDSLHAQLLWKRMLWDEQYRAGRLAVRVASIETEKFAAFPVAKAVRDAAVKYRAAPLQTTVEEQELLLVALIQAFLATRNEALPPAFKIDGRIGWTSAAPPTGDTAAFLKRYLERYLARAGTSFAALDSMAEDGASGSLLGTLQRAILIDAAKEEP